MKRFLGTFAVVLAVLLAFLLFGGSLILGNFWAMLVFCALALTVLSLLGMPASTTHTKTASMAGCASATSRSALDWRIAGQMIFAWLLTFPLCALLSFLLTKLLLRFPI